MELILNIGSAVFIYRGNYTMGMANKGTYPIIRLDDGTHIHLRNMSVRKFELMVLDHNLDKVFYADSLENIQLINNN